MKKHIILVLTILCVFMTKAQIATNETPLGIAKKSTFANISAAVIPSPNMVLIHKADSINDSEERPIRYACDMQVNYNLNNSGNWTILADGSRVWRLKVKLTDALSTNAFYDKFWLPEGSKFFVYSETTGQTLGAITSEYIRGSRTTPSKFATALIYGEEVTFEYFEPSYIQESAIISISRIDYGYRLIDNPYKAVSNFGQSQDCNRNINCPEGQGWQEEKHAIVRISSVRSYGSVWCSGALINNTNNDKTPYVLTARHCVSPEQDAMGDTDLSQWMFYWEYEYPSCDNTGVEPILHSTLGATLLTNTVNDASSDFALLLLIQDPINVMGIQPYYLGWDRTGNAGTGGIGIHHPSGDVKKISQYTMSPISQDDYWKINWITGIAESGSSGSPLINNQHHLIGQCRGGSGYCTNYQANYEVYGKFSVSWSGNGDSNSYKYRNLQPWLDTSNTGILILDGIGCGVNLKNQTVTTNTTVTSLCDINVQNVNIQNNANLILDAAGTTTITSDFNMAPGTTLEIK